MPNQIAERELSSPLAGTDLAGYAVVRSRVDISSVPDLSEQILPIVENIFAVAAARSAEPGTVVTQCETSARAEPTARLDPVELRNGHAQLKERAEMETAVQAAARALGAEELRSPDPALKPPRKPRRVGAYVFAVLAVGAAGAGYAFREPIRTADWQGMFGRLTSGTRPAAAKPVPVAVWAKFPPLPDPLITPGETSSKATTEPIPAIVQKKVLDNYRIQPGSKHTEVVRLVPAEIGGTASSQNLFPLTPELASRKAKLDASLVADWRAGRLSKYEIVWEISNDWLSLAKRREAVTPPVQATVPIAAGAGGLRGTPPSQGAQITRSTAVRAGGRGRYRRGRSRAVTRRAAPSRPRGELTAELSNTLVR